MSSDIVADPKISFGAYCLFASRISVHAIVGRFAAGESVRSIAHDYEIPESDVEDCIRWRLARKPYYPKGDK